MSHSETTDEGTWAIAKPENANKVFYGLCTIAVILVLTDLVYTLSSRFDGNSGHIKGHFGFEDIIGFHAAYGFMAFVLVVLSGTHLRNILMRPLGYYDVPREEPHDDHHHDDHEEHHGDDNHAQDHDEEKSSQEESHEGGAQ
ncbi:MAG: hypothetical protein CL916_12335 [Deltaproteobacteria bacterium]|nr:hypothetical protein [Deltaproteobacteria bacterium]